jgi:hypothetical protein
MYVKALQETPAMGRLAYFCILSVTLTLWQNKLEGLPLLTKALTYEKALQETIKLGFKQQPLTLAACQ